MKIKELKKTNKDLNVADLIEVIRKDTEPEPVVCGDEYVRGIIGLSRLLKCSKTKAFLMNKKGMFDSARVNPNEKIPLFDRKILINIINKK